MSKLISIVILLALLAGIGACVNGCYGSTTETVTVALTRIDPAGQAGSHYLADTSVGIFEVDYIGWHRWFSRDAVFSVLQQAEKSGAQVRITHAGWRVDWNETYPYIFAAELVAR